MSKVVKDDFSFITIYVWIVWSMEAVVSFRMTTEGFVGGYETQGESQMSQKYIPWTFSYSK